MDKKQIIRGIYYFTKRLTKALVLFVKELTKPLSYFKGDEFEKCLRDRIFPKEDYDLVMKTHDYHENAIDYVESSLYPDYLFRDKDSNKEFWVEAKYRENLYQGKLQWCTYAQLKRYKKIGKEQFVVIAIGLGGRPKNPKSIYIIPLNKIDKNALYLSEISDFEFQGKRKNILDNLKDKVYQ